MTRRGTGIAVILWTAGCSGGGGGGGGGSDLAEVEVSPPAATLAAGDDVQFSATAIYENGDEEDVTGAAIWTSSDDLIAEVDATGLVAAFEAGSVTISAEYEDLTGEADVSINDIPFETCLLLLGTTVATDLEHRYAVTAETSDWISGTLTFGAGVTDPSASVLYNLDFSSGSGVVESTWISTSGSASVSADPFAMFSDADLTLGGGNTFAFAAGTANGATFTGGAGDFTGPFVELFDCFNPSGTPEDCILGAGTVSVTRTRGAMSTLTIGSTFGFIVCDEPTGFAPETPREWAHRIATTKFAP